jgi:hypothetical protein
LRISARVARAAQRFRSASGPPRDWNIPSIRKVIAATTIIAMMSTTAVSTIRLDFLRRAGSGTFSRLVTGA